MSKFMPKKPSELFSAGGPYYTYRETIEILDLYFDKEIAPLFENAVEVKRVNSTIGWVDNNAITQFGDSFNKNTIYAESALLINIEPLQQDTPESILREFIKRHDASTENCDWKVGDDDLLERARKLITCDKPPYNVTEKI